MLSVWFILAAKTTNSTQLVGYGAHISPSLAGTIHRCFLIHTVTFLRAGTIPATLSANHLEFRWPSLVLDLLVPTLQLAFVRIELN